MLTAGFLLAAAAAFWLSSRTLDRDLLAR